ncbi:MNS1 [Symbiodinium sp. CCMP2456]|nr:MNS1 [Symbiodinium sp. CCMP2456]
MACGRCPLLSRAVRCTARRAGLGGLGPRPPEAWKHQAYAYLREEAALAQRQARAMMRHVWSNYEQRAFGKDELKPVSGRGTDSWGGLGQTLVDSLDTLWLMGFHEEFDRAADWAESHLDFNKNLNVNYFETSIRHLGGLVSAFVLSSRPGLLGKANDLAMRLAPIFPSPQGAKQELSMSDLNPGTGRLQDWFDGAKRFLHQVFTDTSDFSGELDFDLGDLVEDPSGHFTNDEKRAKKDHTALPLSDVNLQTGKTNDLAGYLSLAETYVPLEWKALALLTSNCSYAVHQDQVLHVLNESAGLETRGYAAILLKKNGYVHGMQDNRISLGSRGDSFYEYLLKDAIFLGAHANPLTLSVWGAFRAKLRNLLVEVDMPRSPDAAFGRLSVSSSPCSLSGRLASKTEKA